jgi:hypothetical protein
MTRYCFTNSHTLLHFAVVLLKLLAFNSLFTV